MIGYGNDTLDRCPPIAFGDDITCPKCGALHRVSISRGWREGAELLFYRCGSETHLAGVKGKSVIGVEPDVSESRPAASLCDRCWITRNPGRKPARVRPPTAEHCALCNREHKSGIYVPRGAL